MDSPMRKRGWSVHTSDGEVEQEQQQQQQQEQQAASNGASASAAAAAGSTGTSASTTSGHKHKRSRSRSRADTEDTLTDEQKAALLEEMPTDDHHDDHHHDHHHDDHDADHHDEKQRASSADSDEIAMFGSDGDGSGDDSNDSGDDSNGEGANPIAQKRQRTGNDELDSKTTLVPKKRREQQHPHPHPQPDNVNDNGNDNANDPEKQHTPTTNLAKKTKLLSKWAARLFDPNRPRGLVEPPSVIPLNDEFITAFGKREREFDEATGREVDIDRTGLDEEEEEEDDKDKNGDGSSDDDEGEGDTNRSSSSKRKKKNKPPKQDLEGCKVKIFNLAYATTAQTLMATCERYGALVDCNLILDRDTGTSTGRAYVTFDHPDSAESCIREMADKRLDGRPLRIVLAAEKPKRDSMGGGGGGPGGGPARYYTRDLSTKCFNCGQVGHMADTCTNAAKPRPCPLCAQTDGHDSWQCPLKATCFNCGVPGHVNRDCPQRRGLARRVVCGRCSRSGHHRWQCQERRSDIAEYEARCMVSSCGREGHFCCKQMGWFFGLRGRYCFNCGSKGHHGMECDRPNLDVCARDAELAAREIDRAEAMSLHDEVLDQRRNGGGEHRGRQRSGGGGGGGGGGDRSSSDRSRSRAKSQPPPPRTRNEPNRGGGNSGGSGGNSSYRGYSPPPPPHGSGGGGGGGGGGRRNSGGGGAGGGGRRNSGGGGGGRSRQQSRGYR